MTTRILAAFIVVLLLAGVAMAQDDDPDRSHAPIRVLTFNVWGLPFGIAPHREARIRAIGPAIAALQPEMPDIVALQEVWLAEDQATLRNALADAGLPHSVGYPDGGLIGSGLVLASRWPIAHAQFEPYTVAGKPTFSDWWARKGFICATISTPHGPLVVINTHCHAGYGDPETVAFRVAQLTQLAEFAGKYRGGDGPRLLCGDLNCRVGSLPFDTAARLMHLSFSGADAGRIDHVLAIAQPAGWRVTSAHPVLGDPVEVAPGVVVPLSDHVGWLASVNRAPAPIAPVRDTTAEAAAELDAAARRAWAQCGGIALAVAPLLALWLVWTFRRRRMPLAVAPTIASRLGSLLRWSAWAIGGLVLAGLVLFALAQWQLASALPGV
ncbi:MAG: endonuclease/exonuclease/phosphatase family protein [Planctomycetota bacterium]